MIKKIALIIAVLASLAIMSCSEDKSSDPTVNDSQAFQSEFTGLAEDVITAPGAVAMSQGSAMMVDLPFSMPMKSVNEIFGKLEKTEKFAQAAMLKKLFPVSDSSSKQEDHLIFANHLGTYTLQALTWYTDPETGEQYVTSATWNAVLGGSQIIISIPKSVSGLQYDIRYELNDYMDELVSWYDAEQYYYSDYYPTIIDLDIFTDNTNVFALDMTGDWEYISALDDVMPKTLVVDLVMAPFSFNLTMDLVGTMEFNLSMNIKENNVTKLSFTVNAVFYDPAWDELSSIDVTYTSNNYTIELFADSEYTTYINSELYTLQGELDMINAGVHAYCKIFEGDNQIGQLKAKIVTVTDDYGTHDELEVYILFNDGSQMTMDQLMLAFGEYAAIVG